MTACRIGVIGTGIMGADHVRTLDRLVSGAEVAAASDVDADRAAGAVAGVDGAVVHRDPFALVRDPGVDAVLVASSDVTHEGYVLACLEAGKPVLCEKPLAPEPDACLRIVEAELASGRALVSVGFMRRYDPAYTALRSLLASGRLGAPLLVHNVHRNPGAPLGQPTEMLITGSAIHEIDLTRWLLGEEVTHVTVHRGRRSSLVEQPTHDPLLLVLETASGVLSDVEVFGNAHYGYDVRCELVGELGTAALEATDGLTLRCEQSASRLVPLDWRSRFAAAYRAELQDWVDGLRAGRTCAASAWEAYAATAVAAAGVQALATGRRTAVHLAARPAAYV